MGQRLPIRNWKEFFDFNCFSPPNPHSSPLQDRLNANLSYYTGNYCCILALALLYTTWQHLWAMLISLSLILAAGYFVFYIHTRPFFVNYRQLSRMEVVIGFASVSAALLLLSGGWMLIVSLLVSLLLIILHAAMRQRSLKAKTVNFLNSLKSTLSGAVKSDDGDDDAASLDVENPSVGGVSRSLNQSAASIGVSADQQAEFRNTFRASMRQKYLRKDK